MTRSANGRGSLEVQAEVLKLARLLGRDPETLAYLERMPAGDLRQLREQITDMLFSADRKTLTRLASASKLLPAGVIATIAQHAFGPLLAARVAELLEPARADEVGSRLPAPFVADIAIELDPRRASDMIARIPPPLVATVTRELLARDEYVTMGRFVGHLSDPALLAALEEIDAVALLKIAFVLEDKDRLDHLLDLLTDERLEQLVDAAAADQLWIEAIDLISHLNQDGQDKLAELARRRQPELYRRVSSSRRP